ncbi:MAG: DUF4136 domain-containing protein [Bacteroidales bacterium]|jgi:hypothetical protein|nr:DUF4136 domain-containing protein [Bacteroidota bacterium]MCF8349495.1 DUF4136 domain-containing protein [Bacteroidales bacterium]
MKKFLFYALLLAFLSSCSSLSVTSDWDKSLNFEQFTSYSLLPWDQHNDSLVNPFQKERLLAAIKDQMNSRGYQYVETGGDLAVSIYITLKDQTGYTAYTDHYGMYGDGWGYGVPWGFYGGGFGGVSSTTVTPYNYTEGTIVLDVFDSKDKKLAWQAVGKGVVSGNPQQTEKSIPKGIAKMFASYPKKPLNAK